MKEIYKLGFIGLYYTTCYLLKNILAVIFTLLLIVISILLIPLWWIKKVRDFLGYLSEILSVYIDEMIDNF